MASPGVRTAACIISPFDPAAPGGGHLTTARYHMRGRRCSSMFHPTLVLRPPGRLRMLPDTTGPPVAFVSDPSAQEREAFWYTRPQLKSSSSYITATASCSA